MLDKNFVIEGDIVSKRNKFDQLFYSYDVKEMNNTNQWNPFIHKEDNRPLDWANYICPYCKYKFKNSSKYKTHLGFMNINLKLWISIIEKRFPPKNKNTDIDDLTDDFCNLGIKRKREDVDIMFKKLKVA